MYEIRLITFYLPTRLLRRKKEYGPAAGDRNDCHEGDGVDSEQHGWKKHG